VLWLLPLAACAARMPAAAAPLTTSPSSSRPSASASSSPPSASSPLVTSPSASPSASGSARTSAPVASVPPLGGALCHARAVGAGVLPDPACTPGATNPDVTQASIGSTICRAGYTGTIRPPAAYTSALKRQQIVAYGHPDTNPADYEEDHP